jgi:hypothetical protein
MSFQITDAVRSSAPVTAAFIGPSGSGKTYSALLFARGLVGVEGRIGVIDTEGRRSLVYADDARIGGFRHLDMRPPYSPDACRAALDAAVADGWRAIIFDSASLEHDGEGGLLEMAEAEHDAILAKNPNNRAAKQQMWTRPKLAHKKFLNHAVGLPAHVIFTFRQTLTTDFNAKPNPVSVLTVVAEKNTMFSLELHAAFSSDHRATWTRVPEPYRALIRQDAPVTKEMGAAIAGSISGAAKASAPAVKPEQERHRDRLVADVADFLSKEFISEEHFTTILGRLKLPTDWRAKLRHDQLAWCATRGKARIIVEMDKIKAEQGDHEAGND